MLRTFREARDVVPLEKQWKSSEIANMRYPEMSYRRVDNFIGGDPRAGLISTSAARQSVRELEAQICRENSL
jgi:hypothetical protein